MTPFAAIAPTTARNALLVLVGGCYLGYHLYHWCRWWRGKKREEETGKREEKRDVSGDSEGMVGRGVPFASHSSNNEVALSPDCGWQGGACPAVSTPQQPIQQSNTPTIQHSNNPTPPADLSGEELYAQARAIPHWTIPDADQDGEYLNLLVQSAAKDYPQALAKLGDYAMRRGYNVEAYYWLWRAKRSGMGNLDRTLLQVRSAWANAGFDREMENESKYFTHARGTVGYALLCIDARHNASAAKARLAECAPDLLKRG